jgi:hypothetical protein
MHSCVRAFKLFPLTTDFMWLTILCVLLQPDVTMAAVTMLPHSGSIVCCKGATEPRMHHFSPRLHNHAPKPVCSHDCVTAETHQPISKHQGDAPYPPPSLPSTPHTKLTSSAPDMAHGHSAQAILYRTSPHRQLLPQCRALH